MDDAYSDFLTWRLSNELCLYKKKKLSFFFMVRNKRFRGKEHTDSFHAFCVSWEPSKGNENPKKRISLSVWGVNVKSGKT